MTCRELIEGLFDYDSGELDAAQRGGFESHLMRCDTCVRYAAEYQVAIAMLRRAHQREGCILDS
jgi:anti-sigma factor RsiW